MAVKCIDMHLTAILFFARLYKKGIVKRIIFAQFIHK